MTSRAHLEGEVSRRDFSKRKALIAGWAKHKFSAVAILGISQGLKDGLFSVLETIGAKGMRRFAVLHAFFKKVSERSPAVIRELVTLRLVSSLLSQPFLF